MCGITGWISRKPLNEPKKTIERMCSCIAHRGPDSRGHLVIEPNPQLDRQIALGHTRLSIIDLSDTGNQPMVDHTGKYYVVFNGEIYNHKEIRHRLAQFNIPFKGTSDTEVLLYSYIHYGEKCLELLNGMFAFAIVDTKKGEVFLARDRIGVKPFYYYEDTTSFAFSSEPSSLYYYMDQNLELNPDALSEYLSYGYIGRSRSILNNVNKVEPGMFILLNNRGVTKEHFWKLQDSRIKEMESATVKTDDVLAYTKELLEDSVRMRLEADVPVGVFLSGGIDSSLVAAAATKVGCNIKTFTIGFSEKDFDESVYAENIARYLHTEHHTFIINENDFLHTVGTYADTYSEPLADPSGIAVSLLSKFTRDYVKVALSGDGGDEQFWGYTTYLHYKKLEKFYHIPRIVRKIIGIYLLQSHNFDTSQIAASVMHKDFNVCMNFFMNLLSVNNLNDKLPIIERCIHNAKLRSENRWMVTDLYNYMVDDVLVKVDRASMRLGLEVRNPLLDYRFVENSFYKVPLSMKIRNQKFVLKEILKQYLPIELFERPKKGFAVPLQKWVNNDLKVDIQGRIHGESILYKYIDKKKMTSLSMNSDFSKSKYGSMLLWRIYLFMMWENRFLSKSKTNAM